jgi:DNA repair photolyase
VSQLEKIRLKGRGAVTNPKSRFSKSDIESFDDGWTPPERLDRLPTITTPEKTKKIITTNDSPDISFTQSINPYKGCEHGCIYCFARPTHAYLGLSPGIDFETKITFKPDAAKLLKLELRKPSYRCDVMALGTNTDPYQPVEKKLRITRGILEVLAEYKNPVGIVTKSQLVLRDLDILSKMAKENLAQVFLSITTLDSKLAHEMEPRAASPEKRLETIRKLTESGVPTGVLASPMIPGLNDSELEKILEAAKEAGATAAGTILLRLPWELKEMFEDWLEEKYPLKAKKVMHLIRETRGGGLYQNEWGTRMHGTGEYAKILTARFDAAVRRLGFNRRRYDLDTSLFRFPPQLGDQIPLFEPTA